mgnify:CR=1 FL=1
MLKTKVGSERRITRRESYESFLTMLNVLGFGNEQVGDLLNQICTDYSEFLIGYKTLKDYYRVARNHKPRELPIEFARAQKDRLAVLVHRNNGLGGNAMRYLLETLNKKYEGVLGGR